MATANPISEDNFVLELNRVKENVVSKFREISEHLDEKKNELLRQINTILVSYQSYKQELGTVNEKKKALEKTKLLLQNELRNSPIKSVHDNLMFVINTELEAIVTPQQPKLVGFVCDEKKLLSKVNELCKLVEKVSEIDYKSKTQSIISVCDRGTGNEQLNCPYGVTVDHNTGNIYVADWSNKCVKVFDNTAKYLFEFGDVKGEGKMYHPIGLLICGNRVLVTQNDNYIQVYQLDGKFVSRFGSSGKGKLQFSFPCGLSTDEYNGDIYIGDHYNNRIQIIFENFEYKSEFGKDIVYHPRDVKLYKDNIFILDESNPCMHIFNKDLVLQKSVVTRGEGQQVVNPWFFCIDKFGSIFISDRNSSFILILSSEFEFIHKISVSNNPMGIIMNEEDRVIVVCDADNNCLQIF